MNLDKLDQAIAYIEAHPEQHDQEHWFYRADGGCGTAACLAGTIALLDGWTPHGWEPSSTGYQSTAMASKGGVVRCVDEVAMDLLCADRSDDDDADFTEEEYSAQRLFEADNTLAQIKRLRDRIEAGDL